MQEEMLEKIKKGILFGGCTASIINFLVSSILLQQIITLKKSLQIQAINPDTKIKQELTLSQALNWMEFASDERAKAIVQAFVAIENQRLASSTNTSGTIKKINP